MGLIRSHKFLKKQRLSGPSFQAVFTNPLYSRSPYFSVVAQSNGLALARLGIVAAKRHIHRAVDRSCLKRKIRESFRLHQDQLVGLDFVVLLRKEAVDRGGSANLNAILERQWQEVVSRWKN